MPPQTLKHFLERSSTKGERSSALNSLQWGLGLILTGIPAAIWVSAPNWILILLSTLLGILFFTYIGSYIFLLFRDRDALRSENFTLSKMAIERGLVGDNITGLIEPNGRTNNLIDLSVINDEETKK